MKFVCDHCGLTTEAASVDITEGRVVLTCQSCGEVSELGVGASAPPPDASDASDASGITVDENVEGGDVTEASGEASLGGESEEGESEEGESEVKPDEVLADRPAEATATTADDADRAVARPPVKCPKCFHRQHATVDCERCGLNLSRAEELRGAWERVPPGKEEAYAHAEKIWASVETDPSVEARLQLFFDHCADEMILTLAVRRLKSRLADDPVEEPTRTLHNQAVERLESVAVSMLAADTWSASVQQGVQRTRRVLVVVAAAFLVVGLILLALLVSRNSGGPTPG